MNEELIYQTLGRLEAQNQLILSQLQEHKEERRRIDEKVNRIEKKLNYAAGVVAAGSAILTMFISPLIGWHR